MTIVLIVVVLIILIIYYQNNKLSVSKYSIKNKKLPKSFNNFVIAHISDVHNTSNKRIIKSLVNEIKRNNVDIIVITGDLIDSYHTNISDSKKVINLLKEIATIYFVTGNHEARIKEYRYLKRYMKSKGTVILDNNKKAIYRNKESIYISGIIDPLFKMKNNRKQNSSEIIKKEIEKTKLNNKKFNILLSHRPEYFNLYKDADLVLTGHAHGGQVRVPLIGGLFAPGQGFFPKYTKGKYSNMIVSSGIGGPKPRINNNPNLVIIKLLEE